MQLRSFQLTTSYRGRQGMKRCLLILSKFQLTTSYRGRPNADDTAVYAVYFNSLPHTEVDIDAANIALSGIAFQLTTSYRGRRRSGSIRSQEKRHFNSLPHTEVDSSASSRTPSIAFQLTTSYRGRPTATEVHFSLDIFQLTTSYRGRPCRMGLRRYRGYFNSLPHTEVDLSVAVYNHYKRNFNSLPHTEVDG